MKYMQKNVYDELGTCNVPPWHVQEGWVHLYSRLAWLIDIPHVNTVAWEDTIWRQ